MLSCPNGYICCLQDESQETRPKTHEIDTYVEKWQRRESPLVSEFEK